MFAARNAHKIIVDSILDVVALDYLRIHCYAPPSQVGGEIGDLNRAIIKFPSIGAVSFVKSGLHIRVHVQ